MLRQTMISQQQFQILRHEWNASQDLIRSLQQQQAELKRQCKKRYELLQPCPMSPTGRGQHTYFTVFVSGVKNFTKKKYNLEQDFSDIFVLPPHFKR